MSCDCDHMTPDVRNPSHGSAPQCDVAPQCVDEVRTVACKCHIGKTFAKEPAGRNVVYLQMNHPLPTATTRKSPLYYPLPCDKPCVLLPATVRLEPEESVRISVKQHAGQRRGCRVLGPCKVCGVHCVKQTAGLKDLVYPLGSPTNRLPIGIVWQCSQRHSCHVQFTRGKREDALEGHAHVDAPMTKTPVRTTGKLESRSRCCPVSALVVMATRRASADMHAEAWCRCGPASTTNMLV